MLNEEMMAHTVVIFAMSDVEWCFHLITHILVRQDNGNQLQQKTKQTKKNFTAPQLNYLPCLKPPLKVLTCAEMIDPQSKCFLSSI